MIKKTFYSFLILIIASIIYLNYFGITTNKFNQNIQKKIQKNYPQFDLKLNDIKILLNISKLSVDLETNYPTILFSDEEIKLKNVSTTYDLKSFFKKKYAIKNLLIETEKNKIKKIIKLARSYKDSAQLLIIDKIIKTGKTEISIKLNFDENGKINQDKTQTKYKGGNLQFTHGARMFLSQSTMTVEPKVGDFYFFPNYLMHLVYPFRDTKEERRSISFNAKIDEEIFDVYGKKT